MQLPVKEQVVLTVRLPVALLMPWLLLSAG
jgi:hypothetical protein